MPLQNGYTYNLSGQSIEEYTAKNQPTQQYDMGLWGMNDYKEKSAEDINYQRAQDAYDPTQQWDWQNPQKLGPQGQALPENALGWKPNGEIDFGPGLGGWWDKLTYNVKAAYNRGHEEGLRISGLTEKLTEAKNVAKAQTEGDIQKQEQQTQADIAKMAEDRKTAVQNSEGKAVASGIFEATKEAFTQTLMGALQGLGEGAVLVEKVLGTAGYTVADIVTGQGLQNLDKNWYASRMAYAGVFDASVVEEMNRFYEAGVRSDLAEMQVMMGNPKAMWSQMIGQFIFDPLNLLVAPGKAAKTLKIIKDAQKDLRIIENPVVREMLEQAGKLDDAKSYAKLTELVKTQQGLGAQLAHADDVFTAEGELNRLSNSYKLFDRTNSGKVSHLANRSSEVLMHVVNNSSPTEAVEILNAMVLSTSADKAKAAEGLATMLRFSDPAALFSKAGNDTTVMLSKMAEKYGDNWLKTVTELKNDKPALIQDLLGKLDKVGQEMFPSLDKMIEAERLAQAGDKTESVLALAEKAKQLPYALRLHHKLQHEIIAGKGIADVNRLFAQAFMGWNPGYAFRNLANNTFTVLTDHGLGALVNADDNFLRAEELYGGLLKAEGFKHTDVLEDAAQATKASKGILNTIKESFQEAKAGKFKSGPTQVAGGKFEAIAAKQVVAKSFIDTFENGIKTMTKHLTPELRAAGFSDDVIKRLPQYILDNKGDAQAVMQAIRNDIKAGVVDVFSDASRIDPKFKKTLEGMNKWADYDKTVLKAESKEEALQNANRIFDELAQEADKVYGEKKMAGGLDDDVLNTFVRDGKMSPTRATMVSRRQEASNATIEMVESILAQADNAGASLRLNIGDMKKAAGINQMSGWGRLAAPEASKLRDLVAKIYRDESKSQEFLRLWKKYPQIFDMPIPETLNKDVFMDVLWKRYDEMASRRWGRGRDAAVDSALRYIDDLAAAGAPVDKKWVQAIQESREYASSLDTAMVGRFNEMIPETRLPYGTRKTQIAELAKKYGIESATADGIPLDKKLLNQIKKYAGVDYRSLEEVPVVTAEEAFKTNFGKIPANPAKTTATLTKAVDVPRSELPPAVSDRFAQEAKRLANELSGGQPGKRTAEGSFGTTNVSWYRELYQKGMTKPAIDKALDKIVMDAGRDKGVNVERMKDLILDNFKYGDAASGTPPDLYVLRELGADDKVIQDALENFNDITKQELTLEEAINASIPAGATSPADLLHNPDMAYFDDAGNLVEPARERIMPFAKEDGPNFFPTSQRMIRDQIEDIGRMKTQLVMDIENNFGRKALVNPVAEKAIKGVEQQLAQKLAETRMISNRVAQASRDFTLLNYADKTNFDLALAYLYPYHYWYKGTYKNWLTRLVTNPAALSRYSIYKDNLAMAHGDMPDWWKNNLNTNDLPGIHTDNPLYFNLEATLWPLNGLTGTDFNDPNRRVNWWTHTLDNLNKFGPSTFAPINMLTGLMLYKQGEEEAGQLWMGRLIPQSNVIKAIGSKLGIGNLEVDPFVNMFMGGLDPYEQKRVTRALGQMEQDAIDGKSPYTREQIQDAAYSQKGEIWDEAVRLAVANRSDSNLMSFFAGVGFKPRTQQDMQIDQFYNDYNKLWTMSEGNNLTPEEFKQGMSALKDKYPFMDTLLLSRKDDEKRDSGLAYLVMGRIPPGQSDDFARAADIDPALLNKFYDTKGRLDTWNPVDRDKFMAGIVTLSSILEIPPDMTRQEWEGAKAAYSSMTTDAKEQFGDNILDMVDGYYAAKGNNMGDAYLQKHPEVEGYMNWKAERVMGSPLLSAYYGGASMVENYYRSKMYADIEAKLGKDVFDVVETYNDLKTYGTTAEYKAYYRQNKSAISQYYDMKTAWYTVIDQKVAQIASQIPEGQGAGYREDIDVTSPTQMDVINQTQPKQAMSFEEFRSVVPERLMNLVVDYYQNGDQLPESAQKQMERLAGELGYPTYYDLLQAIGISYYQGVP